MASGPMWPEGARRTGWSAWSDLRAGRVLRFAAAGQIRLALGESFVERPKNRWRSVDSGPQS